MTMKLRTAAVRSVLLLLLTGLLGSGCATNVVTNVGDVHERFIKLNRTIHTEDDLIALDYTTEYKTSILATWHSGWKLTRTRRRYVITSTSAIRNAIASSALYEERLGRKPSWSPERAYEYRPCMLYLSRPKVVPAGFGDENAVYDMLPGSFQGKTTVLPPGEPFLIDADEGKTLVRITHKPSKCYVQEDGEGACHIKRWWGKPFLVLVPAAVLCDIITHGVLKFPMPDGVIPICPTHRPPAH